MYGLADVEKLRTIGQLIELGQKASVLCEKARSGAHLDPPGLLLLPNQLEKIENIYNFLISFDLEKAENAIANLQLGLSTRLALEQVYLPLLVRLGTEWANAKINIAQEHFASNFLRLRLAPLLITSDIRIGIPKKVVCATLENELHEGGLLLLSAQLKIRNWSVYYMGASLPAHALLIACDAIKPDAVCLSFVNEAGLFSNLEQLSKVSNDIFIGGSAINRIDEEQAMKIPSNVHPLKLSAQDAAEILTEMYRD